jgi:FAD/FMN-containing dehydrogenase
LLTTQNQQEATVTSTDIPALTDFDLDGDLIRPGDDAYDAARATFYGGTDLHPALIARPRDAAGVARVVGLARDTGLELAVRSGGHSGAGHASTEGGILLDVSQLKDIEIDPESRTAWAGSGLTAAEFTTAAAKHGLAVGFGDTGSVGLGGITLGGGVGFLVRKYGLTIDSLLGAEVVTADGRVLVADAGHEPDLFWALRGGGGNFGVVTRFRFRLHPVADAFGGMLILPATPEVLAGFMAAADAAPEDLSAIANVMPAPPMPFVPAELHGKLILMALVFAAGDPDEGERAVAPLRALATPIADMLAPMAYADLYPPEDEDYHPTAVGRTMFVDHVDVDTARMILERLEASDASMRVTQLRALGGAYARVPADATAFAHRSSRVMVNLAAFYDGDDDKPVRQRWVDDFATDLGQGDDGVYVNFVSDERPESVRAAYPGATWDRLAEIKRRYDPANLFRRNHNIPPAA